MTRARDLASGFNGLRPFVIAAGTVTANSSGVSVTLPASRFSVAPRIATSAYVNGLDNAAGPMLGSVTSSGFLMYGVTIGGTSRTASIDWIAIQMASGAASG
jgi:hypothetical protein